MHPLCPPKPKLFDSTGPGSHSRGASRTMSRWISGSCCSSPTVGGISRRSIDRAEATASSGSRRSERMPGHALDGGDQRSGSAEDLEDGFGFGHVVQRSRGAMGIDVDDVARREPGVLECQLHAADRADTSRSRCRDVVGVRARGASEQLGIDVCAPSPAPAPAPRAPAQPRLRR